MTLSREFLSEDQARAREAALQASGYRAWLKKKADGAWEVFWCVAERDAICRKLIHA